MSIQVKFFARLREQLGQDETEIDCQPDMTVLQVWQQATSTDQLPDNTLCAINMDYVDRAAQVNDGDEVAFFPPVTGG